MGDLGVHDPAARQASYAPLRGVAIASEGPLPLVPAVLELADAASVPVKGIAVQRMSRLWDTG